MRSGNCSWKSWRMAIVPIAALGKMLAGAVPMKPAELQEMLIDPDEKRVLLLVVAQRFPDSSKEILPLARKLDFHHDEHRLPEGSTLRLRPVDDRGLIRGLKPTSKFKCRYAAEIQGLRRFRLRQGRMT